MDDLAWFLALFIVFCSSTGILRQPSLLARVERNILVDLHDLLMPLYIPLHGARASWKYAPSTLIILSSASTTCIWRTDQGLTMGSCFRPRSLDNERGLKYFRAWAHQKTQDSLGSHIPSRLSPKTTPIL